MNELEDGPFMDDLPLSLLENSQYFDHPGERPRRAAKLDAAKLAEASLKNSILSDLAEIVWWWLVSDGIDLVAVG